MAINGKVTHLQIQPASSIVGTKLLHNCLLGDIIMNVRWSTLSTNLHFNRFLLNTLINVHYPDIIFQLPIPCGTDCHLMSM